MQAARDSDIKPVRVKSVEQQALQGLHRTRSLWKANRTQRINTLRGLCREFGIAIGERTAEDVKIQIGTALPMDPELTMEVRGRDLIAGLPRTITIGSNEITEAMDHASNNR